jgi:hypothetical protein
LALQRITGSNQMGFTNYGAQVALPLQ